MPLFFFPLLFVVPFFVMAMILFFVGAIVLRMLFFVAIAAFAGAVLFGSGLLGAVARALGFGARRAYWRYQNRQFDGPPRRRDPDHSAFDDYRRATLNKLDDEAREFRAFLAKLRQAADASDFQDFLNSRRAGS
ncbi:MAG: DUF2852 domain-containing protein [Hyphomicrobium sp.]|uniref:DUF2852 domain-containing protein n=1 Tax=Hyphomicrobium sp. TaxID=82 RepID=UPI00356970A8